LLKKFTDQYNH